MYAWMVKTIAVIKEVDIMTRKRYLITASNRAEDAYDKARRIDTLSSEQLKEVNYLGYVPSMTETGLEFKPELYYVQISYLYPRSGPGSLTTRTVPNGFLDKIDINLARAIGVEDTIGAIASGPRDAIDISQIGLVIGLTQPDPEEARDLVSSHVFDGTIAPENLFVLALRKILAT